MPEVRLRPFRPRGACAAAAVGGLLSPAAAWAQVETRAQATFNASIGWTDNVLQAPDNPVGDELGPESDGLVVLVPGAALIFETPGTTHTLAYSFGLSLFFVHSEANAFTHSLVYASTYGLGPTTTLGLGTGATLGQTSNFNRTRAPQGALVEPVQPGNDLFLNVFVNETITQELSPTLLGSQSTTATVSRTLNELEGAGFVLANVLTLQRPFESDIVGGELGVDYSRSAEGFDEDGELTAPAQHELTSRLAATWQHQYTPEIASTLAAGVVHHTNAETFAEHLIHPYGAASIGYVLDQAAATLSYVHTAGPNVFLNQVTISDTISLAIGIPLGQLPLDLGVGGGFASNRVILENGDLSPAIQVAVVDAGLTYTPPQLPSLSIGARYQFTKQLPSESDETGEVPDAVAFTQNSAFLTVGLTFPDFVEGGDGALLASPFRPAPTGNLDLLRPPPPPPGEEPENPYAIGGDGQGGDPPPDD